MGPWSYCTPTGVPSVVIFGRSFFKFSTSHWADTAANVQWWLELVKVNKTKHRDWGDAPHCTAFSYRCAAPPDTGTPWSCRSRSTWAWSRRRRGSAGSKRTRTPWRPRPPQRESRRSPRCALPRRRNWDENALNMQFMIDFMKINLSLNRIIKIIFTKCQNLIATC